MTKKEQLQIRELVGKISDTCMRINFETDRAAFFWMSGHVSLITVHIAESKKDYNNDIAKWDEHYGNSWNTTKEIIAKLTDHKEPLLPIWIKLPNSVAISLQEILHMRVDQARRPGLVRIGQRQHP